MDAGAGSELQNTPPDPEDGDTVAEQDAATIVAQLNQHAADVGELESLSLPEHVDFYQRAHAELQQALTDIDNA